MQKEIQNAMLWAENVCTTPTTARILGIAENVEAAPHVNVAQKAEVQVEEAVTLCDTQIPMSKDITV